MSPTPIILHIAVPSPLPQGFDYLPPKSLSSSLNIQPGMRARIPFGRSQTVGTIIDIKTHSDVDKSKLKHANTILDEAPVLPQDILNLGVWASRYYHYPIGEVFDSILPPALRQGKPAQLACEVLWQLTDEGRAVELDSLKRAPRQQQLLGLFLQHEQGIADNLFLSQFAELRPTLTTLEKKSWLIKTEIAPSPAQYNQPQHPYELNDEQRHAIDQVISNIDQFAPYLLEGITGSGKTEVYLHLIEHVLKQGKQVLILVPEIGLTPQLMSRFSERFNQSLAVLHSGLTDQQRLQAWLSAKEQVANIILGTRSAIFTPMKNLGLIIIDEEHDLSFKQQEGFRYSARDLAVQRAHQCNIPIILGSATPSFESLNNAISGRYHWLKLNQRAGNAKPPNMRFIDIRGKRMHDCLSPQLVYEIGQRLERNEQVLVFLNRRGYAPVLICHKCSWQAECPRCDAKMTLHMKSNLLRCHHCDTQRSIPQSCPSCQHEKLVAVGKGTERIDELLAQQFPNTKILRIDRDTTRRKGAMESLIAQVHAGEGQILIGTQMIAKGHHFPNVTLACIIDGDYGLFSNEFRAAERMAQMIIQVAGRSGRASAPGEVLIQTHQPENPLLTLLIQKGYHAFALQNLKEREETLLPPFANLAMIRVESVKPDQAIDILEQAKQVAQQYNITEVDILGPIPAPMAKRAGRYRAQLLFASEARAPLHKLLSLLIPWLYQNKSARKVRWSLDVDPQETY